jgi:hypothetical protein
MFTTLLYLGVCWYVKFEKAALIIGLCFYTLTVIPSFFLHISYYIRNRGTACEILPDRLRLEIEGKETIIASSDIKEIIVYKSASMDAGGIPITPMEAYFFVRIFDTSGNKYELTCLMDTKVDKSIKVMRGVPIYTERGFFNNV